MRKPAFVLILLFFFVKSYSQVNAIISFNNVAIGRNISITVNNIWQNHSVICGFKYNINRKVHDNQNHIFLERFYAKNLLEHFGLNLGYQYKLNLKNSKINPFLFYDFQFTHSHTRNHMYLPYDFDVNGDVLYKEYLEYFGPFIVLEHNIGIGFTTKLYKKVFIYQKAGTGIATFHGNEPKLYPPIDNSWEFGYIISAGLGYSLK